MTRFFRRSGVKALCAILCVLCLSLSLLSGAAVLTLLENDGYRDPSNLYASMIQSRVRAAADRVTADCDSDGVAQVVEELLTQILHL